MKLSVLLVIARLPLDFFQREVELNGKEKKCLYFKGIYLLAMRMPFNLEYIDMDYHDKTKPLPYIFILYFVEVVRSIMRSKFIFVTICAHLHTYCLYPDFALISQN